jgi:hypothetical protein
MKKINRRRWLKRAGIFVPATVGIIKAKASWYYAAPAAAAGGSATFKALIQ